MSEANERRAKGSANIYDNYNGFLRHRSSATLRAAKPSQDILAILSVPFPSFSIWVATDERTTENVIGQNPPMLRYSCIGQGLLICGILIQEFARG